MDKELVLRYMIPLLKLEGVSGREAPVIRYMEQELRSLVDELRIDPMGNVFAVRRGKRGPRLLITAHSDEIGLYVKSVEKNGFLRFEKVGGVQDALLQGRLVRVGCHLGVVGVKAGHLATEEERSRVKKASELYIDVGASSEDEVRAMGIVPGTPVTFVQEPVFLTDQDLLVSKSVDDRVGCAVVLALMHHLKDASFNGEVHVAITVQEEVGLRGATVAAYAVDPDLALALDTIPSGDTPDVSLTKELPVSIGKGPVFQVMSGGSGRGMIADTTILTMLAEAARRADVPYQTTIFSGGNTDAAAMHLARAGIPSAAVTIPRRYSHSPVEMVNLNDAVGAGRVLLEFIKSMPETIQWKLPGEVGF